MTLLADTNVVSELRKRRADEQVVAWSQQIPSHQVFLSAITVQELATGVGLVERRDAEQGARLWSWLMDEVLPGYAGRILPIDVDVATRAGALHVPDRRPERDALIAATALVHGLTVATRNVADFEPMGVAVINPWEPR